MKHIGIDTGTNTGLSVWDDHRKAFDFIETMTITRAMDKVRYLNATSDVCLYIEDARLRKWFGNTGREKLQGAGSVKRDAVIWEGFCKENAIAYKLVAPRNNTTKLDAVTFRRYTGWSGKTNEHGRDAALLVFGK